MDKEKKVTVSVKGILYRHTDFYRGEVRLGYRMGQRSRQELYVPVATTPNGPHFSLERIVEEHANTVKRPTLRNHDKEVVGRTILHVHDIWAAFFERMKPVKPSNYRAYMSPRLRHEFKQHSAETDVVPIGGSLQPTDRPTFTYEDIGLYVPSRYRKNGAKRQDKGVRMIRKTRFNVGKLLGRNRVRL